MKTLLRLVFPAVRLNDFTGVAERSHGAVKGSSHAAGGTWHAAE
ncbi:hypothetical protein [Prosthecobacter sp.]|nr:hypothetical protein [Prosthecobacter sp.]MDZ4404913.1 hypothetical protein [Prosthecobacter sp.]